MNNIQVFNVNDALCFGVSAILRSGIPVESRNGRALMVPNPVTTTYVAPCERVLFSPERDANPFFHLMESMWMLAGRNDVAFPSYYSKQLASYSVDGKTLHGAYGYRWRKHFGYDQIEQAIADLRASPNSRQVIVQMWDATVDGRTTPENAKDRPCNDIIKFQAIPTEVPGHYRLNMSVFCRSNDAVWGCYGANAVHFSILLEYVAHAAGMEVGSYFQISDNLHIYDASLYGESLFSRLLDTNTVSERTGFPVQLSEGLEQALTFTQTNEAGEEVNKFMISQYNLYTKAEATFLSHPFTLVNDAVVHAEEAKAARAKFDAELEGLLDNPLADVSHAFLRLVIQPLMLVYKSYKENRLLEALHILKAAEDNLEEHCAAEFVPGESLRKRVVQEGCRVDWFVACEDWLLRRPSVIKFLEEQAAAAKAHDQEHYHEESAEAGEVIGDCATDIGDCATATGTGE